MQLLCDTAELASAVQNNELEFAPTNGWLHLNGCSSQVESSPYSNYYGAATEGRCRGTPSGAGFSIDSSCAHILRPENMLHVALAG